MIIILGIIWRDDWRGEW